MFIRLIFLVVVAVSAFGCGQQKEDFPTAGAPGSTSKLSPDSPVAKYRDAAAKAGHMNNRPGQN